MKPLIVLLKVNFCAIMLVSTSLEGQIHLEINRRPLDVRMDQVMIDEGKGNPSVYHIIQDHNGYMWFSSEASLHWYNGYTYENFYSKKNDSTGFVGNYSTCLYEDSEGHIWLGTFGGLNCLDPETKLFTHYYFDSTDLTKINDNNVVRHIAEDRFGIYWFITRGNIYSLEKSTGEIREYVLPSKAYPESGTDIPWGLPGRFLEDSDGQIWIPSSNGLYKYLRDKDKFIVFHYDSITTEQPGIHAIYSLIEDTEGRIWYAPLGTGLYRIIDKETGESEKFHFEVDPEFEGRVDTVSQLSIGPDSCLWVAGNGWFAKIDYYLDKQEVYRFEASEKLWEVLDKIMYDTYGNVWFFNHHKAILYRFNPKTGVLSDFPAHSWLGIDCFQDESGAFWVGTAYGYAGRIDPYESHYQMKEGREFYPEGFTGRNPVMVEDVKGTKWVVADGIFHLENIDDFDEIQPVSFSFPDNMKEAHDMIIDKHQNLWFAHNDNLIRKYNSETGVSEYYDMLELSKGKVPDDLVFDHTLRIVMDTSDRIWMFNHNNYLVYLDPDTKLIGYVNFQGSGNISDIVYLDIIADNSGNIWIASLDGICRLNTGTLKTRWYRSDPGAEGGLQDNAIFDIEEDPFGNLWCLSNHSGVYFYNREIDDFDQFLPIQSKFNPYSKILITPDSSVWVSSWGRILKYDLHTDILKAISLEHNSFHSSIDQVASGDIYLFCNGFYIFPNDIGTYKIPPRILISGLNINETDYKNFISEPIEISSLKKIELKHNENYLRFEYVGLLYNDQDEVRYRYQLRGADQDTVDAGARLFVDYFDLKPGKYNFWVSACNSDGVWHPTGTSMDIRIIPPWYGSVMAYFCYVLILAFGIVSYTRWRTWRLRKEKDQLEKQVSERTRTIEQQKEEILSTNDMLVQQKEELSQQKEELQVTLDRLKETQDRLIQSEKFAALGGLVAGVAHEINTPVGISVTAASSLAEETQLMAEKYKTNKISRNEFKEYLNITNQSAKLILANMERTATMVQSFKQVSVDQSTEQKRQFRLKEYFEDVIRSLYPKIKQKNIDVQIEIDDRLELNSYPGDFSQILTNLILNSFIHGFIDRESGEIRISANVNGKDLGISYSDNGKGISKEDLEMIFDPFFTTDKKLGTGLGLHIVYNLVSQRLGGTIDCESKSGNGVRFNIVVPKQ